MAGTALARAPRSAHRRGRAPGPRRFQGPVPFDAVLPTSARIDTAGREGIGVGSWGWLIATRRILDLERLRAARFHVEVEDRRVRAGMRLLNLSHWAPLRPREIAGPLVLERAHYNPCLSRSERFRDSLVEAWGVVFDFPADLEAETRLHCELWLAGHRLEAQTRLLLAPSAHDLRIEGGQRLHAVPLEGRDGALPAAERPPAMLVSSAR